MTRKGEKIANLSISILEPPSVQMTCTTSNFRLESFSSDINDLNYLHLPPPNPYFGIKNENICYTDIPMYAMAIAVNKNSTAIRECSIFGNVFYGSRDIGRFSSSAVGLTDFIIQPNEQVFIPFQIKIPHLISSVSSQTKISRIQSGFNTEIGSNHEMNHPTKQITINSFFHFRANENNQKMQINTVEKVNVQNSLLLSYKLTNSLKNSHRNSFFQVTITNNLPIFIRNVEVKAIEQNPRSSVPVPNSTNHVEIDNLKKKFNRSIKLGDSVESRETVCGYTSYSEPFHSIEVYFLLPFCTFCCFPEPILTAQNMAQNASNLSMAKQLSQQNYSNKQASAIGETKRSPSTSSVENRSDPIQKVVKNPPTQPIQKPPVSVPQQQNLTFQASLNKLPKAVQTLRPFSIQIQIVNTTKTNAQNQGEVNNNNAICGSIVICENESITLFGINDLTFPYILPGQCHVLAVSFIALKQGNFSFPKIIVKLKNNKNTEVDFETGVIAIGCNE